MADYYISKLGGSEKRKRSPKQQTEFDIARQQWNAYTAARDNGHSDYVVEAKQLDAYYRGEQWDETTVQQLDAEGRPHLTINLIMPVVNAAIGQLVNSREDIAFVPKGRGATEEVARVLSFVARQIQANNRSKRVERQVFEDGLIQDRGFFEMFIDFSDNLQGEVREVSLDPVDVIIDPYAREYDPNTWNEVFVSRWLTPDQIAARYGEDKAEQVRRRRVSDRFGSDSIEFETPNTFGEQRIDTAPPDPEDVCDVRRVRVIQRQYRKLVRRKYFVDLEQGDMRPVPDSWSDEKIEAFARQFGLEILEKPEQRIRWTETADNVLLYDDWSLYNRFTVIPFFPYFRRGKPVGLVRNLLSPQDLLNKLTSQELHVVNTTANSGWVFETGSLVNMDAHELEQYGAKTGLVLEYQRGATPPAKIEPNQVPTGLTNIAAKAQTFFQLVSGIPNVLTGGQPGREISGVALENQFAATTLQLDVILDNLAYTRQLRAEMMLELIQQFYTETRLLRITDVDEDGNEQSTELTVNQPSPEGVIINDLTLGEYSVSVTSIPSSDSLKDSIFSQALSLREAGVAIPDHILIEHSRLENRREVADLVKRLQNLAEPTPEEMQMQMQMQQLELARQEAEVRSLISKSMLQEAQAQKAMVEAGITQQEPMLELQKLGAEMRARLEEQLLSLQEKQAELQARIQIAEAKNRSEIEVARIESLTKRVSNATQERIAERKSQADLLRQTLQQRALPDNSKQRTSLPARGRSSAS